MKQYHQRICDDKRQSHAISCLEIRNKVCKAQCNVHQNQDANLVERLQTVRVVRFVGPEVLDDYHHTLRIEDKDCYLSYQNTVKSHYADCEK